MLRRSVFVVSLLFCSSVNCIPRWRDNHHIYREHNVEHDHKTFLGEKEKEVFDKLTPEQSRARLSEIVDKIDKDEDGKITVEELRSWIEYIQLKHLHDKVDKQWSDYDRNGDMKISWDEFKNTSYGHTSEIDSRTEDKRYKAKRELDKRKWKAADSNYDNALTKEEFSAFLHPNQYKRMHKVAVEDVIRAVDKDEDGLVSLDEYIGDVNSEKEPPKWLEEEKNDFLTERDKDGDRKLNREEAMEWLFPPGYNALDAEAKHLMSHADQNKDDVLTKQEILNKQDIFVGSQATNFGETLKRPVDEL